jgi:WhiB family transcriptional regulator, redox-sensing transcriptional regulator
MSEPLYSAKAHRQRRLPIDASHPGWLVLMGRVLRGTVRLEGAACRGQWRLFDGVDEASRRAAAELCDECPALSECRQWVRSLSAPQKPPGVTAGQYRFRGGGTP